MSVSNFDQIDSLHSSLLHTIHESIRIQKDRPTEFHIAISGGNTPLPFFDYWVQNAEPLLYKHVHLWWVDERCVPVQDPRSNYFQAKQHLIDPLSWVHVHPMVGEGDPFQNALDYAAQIQKSVPQHSDVPVLDLVLLGMGPDGHVASLFPQSPVVTRHPWVGVSTSPDGLKRLTLTYPVLLNARQIVFFVTGSNKKSLLEKVWQRDSTVQDLPVSQVFWARRDALWFVCFNH